jgi:hypothetical protein
MDLAEKKRQDRLDRVITGGPQLPSQIPDSLSAVCLHSNGHSVTLLLKAAASNGL